MPVLNLLIFIQVRAEHSRMVSVYTATGSTQRKYTRKPTCCTGLLAKKKRVCVCVYIYYFSFLNVTTAKYYTLTS